MNIELKIKEAIREKVVNDIEQLINNTWYGTEFTQDLTRMIGDDDLSIIQGASARDLDGRIEEEFVDEVVDFIFVSLKYSKWFKQ